jgi:predicted 2-oxoglutarate/Fe(II)-dependent dioxygenase YbiX
MTIKNPLTEILTYPNALSAKGLEELQSHINSTSERINASIFDAEKTNDKTDISWKEDVEARNTQYVPYEEELYKKIKSFLHEIAFNVINPFYELRLKHSEIPQILSYDVGGHYKPHIDGEAMWRSPTGDDIWKKSIDRDLSIIIFLNDDFEGGDLVFPQLKIRIRPEPGLMVCFPSTHMYVHGVEPVTKGKRYSMVTWATIHGFKSLEDVNKELSEKYGVPVV